MNLENSSQTDREHRSNWTDETKAVDFPKEDPDAVETDAMADSLNEPSDDEYVDPDAAGSHDEMDAMIDQYLDQMSGTVSQGNLLTVPVVAVKDDHVLVDVGEKS